MSRVDVLIPTFNAAHVLPGAIDSVIAQTEPDWHIIVVDDGSTDNTVEVVAPYLDRLGARITYLPRSNGGPSAARNAGIRASDSPFIAMLDADDLWLPDRLRRALPLFDDPEVALAYGGIHRFREPGKLVDTFTGSAGKREGAVAEEIYTRRIEIPCSSVTVRRSALDQTGLFDEAMRTTEDRDLWLRLAQRYRIAFVPEVLVWYRMSPDSLSADPVSMLENQRRFLRKHRGEPGCGWLPWRFSLARAHKQQAEAYADRRRFPLALRHALHAATLAPWELNNLRTAASITLRALRA